MYYWYSNLSEKLFSLNNNCILLGNKAHSYGPTYASYPAYVSFNNTYGKMITMISGETIPLEFYLTDRYNNLIKDNPKLHSSLELNIDLIEEKESK